MKVVGIIATATIAAVAAVAAITGYKSIPDIRRYIKIRSM